MIEKVKSHVTISAECFRNAEKILEYNIHVVGQKKALATSSTGKKRKRNATILEKHL